MVAALGREKQTERRCILTRETLPKERMVRFVLSPDDQLVPDVAEKLPGRGLWIQADRDLIEKALEKGALFSAASRALKQKVSAQQVGDDMLDVLEKLLRKRVMDRLGLEQRAGNVMTGFDKIKADLGKSGAKKPVLLLHASDGSEDGERKMRSTIGLEVRICRIFNRDDLSCALGKDNVVHAIVYKSGGADVLLADLGRLEGIGRNTADED
ncbi:DNA-binding protein [Kordiimonas sediminis]|uniref:DNA-binding protein n=1 Tax=Kordiimonas sediminis TaxID=1735581 RepID=A0A919AMP9_9PROT|nr:RNA-binding protein [Kordiimonas sediminis]GHF16335.1 DNA-binding protein [Kordiimonas sediminis]